MATIVRRRSIGAAGLLVLACAGVANAQLTSEPPTRTKYQNCGPFTVLGGHMVLVHAALDDFPDARPTRATLQLLNELGVVQAQKEVVLQPSQSTTLVMSIATAGATVLRAHVEFREAALAVSARRTSMSLVEDLDLTGAVRTMCIPPDNGVRPPAG